MGGVAWRIPSGANWPRQPVAVFNQRQQPRPRPADGALLHSQLLRRRVGGQPVHIDQLQRRPRLAGDASHIAQRRHRLIGSICAWLRLARQVPHRLKKFGSLPSPFAAAIAAETSTRPFFTKLGSPPVDTCIALCNSHRSLECLILSCLSA